MPHSAALDVSVTLRRGVSPRVSLERVTLLEAVAELGSITAAASRLGLSFRGAWDIVQGLNNLFDTPLVEAAPGGRGGGAARVTDRGRDVMRAFHKVQAAIDAALGKLDADIAADVAGELLWSLGMRTSARNALRGEIVRITTGAVNSEVTLKLGDGVEIISVLTCRSVEDLQLSVGQPAIALIKSNFVLLAKGEGLRTSARNQIRGVVASREDGAVNSEVILDIGGGKTLVASLTSDSAASLEISAGDAMTALIKAPHVILAVD